MFLSIPCLQSSGPLPCAGDVILVPRFLRYFARSRALRLLPSLKVPLNLCMYVRVLDDFLKTYTIPKKH